MAPEHCGLLTLTLCKSPGIYRPVKWKARHLYDDMQSINVANSPVHSVSCRHYRHSIFSDSQPKRYLDTEHQIHLNRSVPPNRPSRTEPVTPSMVLTQTTKASSRRKRKHTAKNSKHAASASLPEGQPPKSAIQLGALVRGGHLAHARHGASRLLRLQAQASHDASEARLLELVVGGGGALGLQQTVVRVEPAGGDAALLGQLAGFAALVEVA